MVVGIPTEVSRECFFKYGSVAIECHRHMVFEAILADMLHQVFQPIDLDHCAISKGIQWIIRHIALTNVGADATITIVGAYARKSD